jgi:hypothetical protein
MSESTIMSDSLLYCEERLNLLSRSAALLDINYRLKYIYFLNELSIKSSILLDNFNQTLTKERRVCTLNNFSE